MLVCPGNSGNAHLSLHLGGGRTRSARLIARGRQRALSGGRGHAGGLRFVARAAELLTQAARSGLGGSAAGCLLVQPAPAGAHIALYSSWCCVASAVLQG